MYKYVFRNRWVALAFAIMTLVSAVSMVGTSEKSGTIGQIIDLLGVEGHAGADAQPGGPWASTEPTPYAADDRIVIGDYVAPDRTASEPDVTPPRH